MILRQVCVLICYSKHLNKAVDECGDYSLVQSAFGYLPTYERLQSAAGCGTVSQLHRIFEVLPVRLYATLNINQLTQASIEIVLCGRSDKS